MQLPTAERILLIDRSVVAGRVGDRFKLSDGPSNSHAVAPMRTARLLAMHPRPRVAVGSSTSSSAEGGYLPALKLVKVRVCTRRMSCGTGSGTVMAALAASLGNTLGLLATSGLTCFNEALFGLA